MRRFILIGCVVFAACGLALLLRAADAPSRVAVPALPDMEETFAPGLKLTIEQGAIKDVRDARLVALRVPADSPASPFVQPGPFKATWEGAILLRIKGDYAFSAIGSGAVKVTINDEVALEAPEGDFAGKTGPTVKLKKGKNPIKVEYTSPKEGDASIRLIWSAKEFIPESVPPTLFVHDSADKPLREGMRLRQGRELMANLRCLKCHTSDATTKEGGAMRELAADTPSLQDIGQRHPAAWLAAWINNPHAMRPDSEMPRVFHAEGDAIDPRAKDIAAYLVESSAKKEQGEEKDDPELVTQGARLFSGLGCVGCHVLPDQQPPADAPVRVSLKYVKAKFQPGALKEFLLKPEQHYQWIRMPNFRFSDAEASALAAFLRSRTVGEIPGNAAGGDPKHGQELFQSQGCISCHSSKLENSFKTKPLSELTDWTRGCVASDPARRGNAPDFGLDDTKRAAILSLASTEFASLKRDTTAEFAERQLTALNCVGCHARDKQDDNWSQLSAEVEALTKDLPAEEDKADQGGSEISGDQSRPPLTWVGEKLRPQWMADFISGSLKYKPRPWLRARMPGFASRGKAIAQGLALSHGCPPAAPRPGKSDPRLAEIGKKLISKNGGFSCIQCHGVADQKPLAPFEAPAINFAHVSERLNPEYYDRWVYNPQRVLPGTRMPSFADSSGKTALKDTLDGDAKKQFDAIWNFLLLGEKVTPP